MKHDVPFPFHEVLPSPPQERKERQKRSHTSMCLIGGYRGSLGVKLTGFDGSKPISGTKGCSPNISTVKVSYILYSER